MSRVSKALAKALYGKNGETLWPDQQKEREHWFRTISQWKHQIREVRMGNGDYEGVEMRDKVPEDVAVRGLDGNLFSSELKPEEGGDARGLPRHTIALDIDVPMHVEESSTPGHHHLFIDVQVDWNDYAELLELLGRLGVLEDGYVQASLRRQATDLRLPWVSKDDLPKERDSVVEAVDGDLIPQAPHEWWVDQPTFGSSLPAQLPPTVGS